MRTKAKTVDNPIKHFLYIAVGAITGGFIGAGLGYLEQTNIPAFVWVIMGSVAAASFYKVAELSHSQYRD